MFVAGWGGRHREEEANNSCGWVDGRGRPPMKKNQFCVRVGGWEREATKKENPNVGAGWWWRCGENARTTKQKSRGGDHGSAKLLIALWWWCCGGGGGVEFNVN